MSENNHNNNKTDNKSTVDKKPRVINASGTTRLNNESMQRKSRQQRHNSGNSRRRSGRRTETKKEFKEATIFINRVSRTVKGGRRMRFQALVAIGDGRNRVGVGLSKGADVSTAVQKATERAKKDIITFPLNGETIHHEVTTKVTGAKIMLKPAAPGTGLNAGGVVTSILSLTGIKNVISKSLGSSNKTNVAYAVIEGLKEQVPRKDWITTKIKKQGDK